MIQQAAKVAEQIGPVAREAFARIDALAAKLGVAAGHIYSVYQAQAAVELALSWLTLAGCIAFIVGYAVFVAVGIRKEWDFDNPALFIPTIVGGLASFMLTIGAIATVGDLVTLTNNPEFWVIHQIIGAK